MLDYLQHYGVLGMKWGVRRSKSQLGYSSDRKVRKAQKKYDKKVNKNYIKTYNQAVEYANSTLIPKINKKYSKYDFTNSKNSKVYQKYINEYETEFAKIHQQKISDLLGERPK